MAGMGGLVVLLGVVPYVGVGGLRVVVVVADDLGVIGTLDAVIGRLDRAASFPRDRGIVGIAKADAATNTSIRIHIGTPILLAI